MFTHIVLMLLTICCQFILTIVVAYVLFPGDMKPILRQTWQEIGTWFLRQRFLLRWRWERLWIREDEFDSSLSFNPDCYALRPAERLKYQEDLIRRRSIAHEREFASSVK